jgi:hypothetical protein
METRSKTDPTGSAIVFVMIIKFEYYDKEKVLLLFSDLIEKQ